MQFLVPQFIDVEDKIFGPFSVRQFIILIVAAGALFVSFRLADTGLFIVEAVIIAVLTIAFAFIRVNGRPFHYFLINLIQMIRRPQLRIWHRDVTSEELRLPRVVAPPKHNVQHKPPLTASRLAELSLVVDTGGVYKQEE
jgi:hypothetical protein